jgi:CheY-like chemotaxis protein
MKKSQRHVLIVEDNAFLAKAMRKVLSANGLRVSAVESAQEAIKIIDVDTPHLLLLDLLLPHIDGFAVLEHRKEKKQSFAVIICSNLSDKATKDKCKAFGISAFVVKSDMDDEELWPVVEKYLK